MKRSLDTINGLIAQAVQLRGPDVIGSSCTNRLPRLVAVSKTKPISAIIEAYECGQRFFGENYIQELEDKSNSPEIIAKCPDIKFHFIGRLQTNKVNHLLRVRNLHVVETVDSSKLADLINKAINKHLSDSATISCGDHGIEATPDVSQRLKVMIQVNTSGEENKGGVNGEDAPRLAEHIVKECARLQLVGLMTIGKFEGWPDSDVNLDFLRLYNLREAVAKHLSMEARELELSMGMSGDFEEAIRMGSTNVRVGSMIFGERERKG